MLAQPATGRLEHIEKRQPQVSGVRQGAANQHLVADQPEILELLVMETTRPSRRRRSHGAPVIVIAAVDAGHGIRKQAQADLAIRSDQLRGLIIEVHAVGPDPR